MEIDTLTLEKKLSDLRRNFTLVALIWRFCRTAKSYC